MPSSILGAEAGLEYVDSDGEQRGVLPKERRDPLLGHVVASTWQSLLQLRKRCFN